MLLPEAEQVISQLCNLAGSLGSSLTLPSGSVQEQRRVGETCSQEDFGDMVSIAERLTEPVWEKKSTRGLNDALQGI